MSDDASGSSGHPALGFGLPVSGSWATPGTVREVARRAEELGYASLWSFQRLLHPAQGSWGEAYRSVLDPLAVLAHVAAVTDRARLGVAVLNAPFYPPLLLAKQLATLDVLSQGRLDVGLGLGWAPEEFAAVGVPFERRGARLEETVEVLSAAWGPDPVRHAGDLCTVQDALVQPKPVQQPRPPVLLGGGVPAALRRVGRVADGWISASRQDLRAIGDAVDTIRAAADEAGRDPDGLRYVVRGVLHLGQEKTDRSGARRPLTGSAEAVRDDLGALAAQGVTEVFLDLNFVPRVGSPDADPQASREHAEEVLETFAPLPR